MVGPEGSPKLSGQSRQVPTVCPGHSRPLAGLCFSGITPDGVFLISACHDKQPMLRDGVSGDWIGTFQGHKGAVWSAKLNSDATFALTGSADFSVKAWDAITGEELHTFPHSHVVKSVEFSPNSRRYISGGNEGILRLFDLVEPNDPPIQIAVGKPITNVIWSKLDVNKVYTGTNDGKVRAWDLRTNSEVQSAEVKGSVMDLEQSMRGDILTVAAGQVVTFLDWSTLSVVKSHRTQISFAEEGGASLHPSGQKFIAGGSDLWVHVFDFDSGTELECNKGHHGPVRCLRYAPGGGHYATGSEDGTIRIWQTDPH